MLESIITDYLQYRRRLIVPTLGAFLKKEDGTVVFAPFLNKDDGVFVGLVAQSYGASPAEAGEMVGRYADNLLATLDASGGYLIAGLGTLKRDANGILFLDTADSAPQRAAREPVVEQVVAGETILPEPEPVFEPEPTPVPFSVPENRIMADTLDTPLTLNDLIRERQERQAPPPPTIHQRAVDRADAPKPVRKASPSPRVSSPNPVQPQKRGDLVLILAVVAAILALAALIYGYAATEMELPNLN